MGFRAVGLALLFAFSAQAQDCKPSEQGAVAKFLHRNFGKGAFDLNAVVQKFFITDPAKQILPGDVLVYPFKNQEQPAEPGSPNRDLADEPPPRIEPDAYKAALEGYGHAGIVARDEDGELYHLDAPLPPPFVRGEFQGKDHYYVVRPKLPPGVPREEFEKRVNDSVTVFKRLGFEYDALMQMDFLNKGDLDKLKAIVAKGAPEPQGRPDTQNSPIPAQFCSELVQTILVLSGAEAARGVNASRLFSLALDKVKEEMKGKDASSPEGKAAIQKAVDDIITMFAGPLDTFEANMKRNLKEVEDELVFATKENDTNAIESLKEAKEDIRLAISRLGKERTRWEQARLLLGQVALLRAQNPNLDPLGVMKRPIVRPIDILREAQRGDGNYEVVGYYPGHLPQSCFPPRFDEPPPGENGGPLIGDPHDLSNLPQPTP